MFLRFVIKLTFLLGVTTQGLACELHQTMDAAVHEAPKSSLEVIEFVLTDKVAEREPQRILDTFKQNEKKAFAFVRLKAPVQEQVIFVWLFEGSEYARVSSLVGVSERWRTYSSAQLKPGAWTVKLMAKDNVLAERHFTVSS